MYVDSILRDYEYYMFDMTRRFKSYYGKPEYLCQISVSTHGPQGFYNISYS